MTLKKQVDNPEVDYKIYTFLGILYCTTLVVGNLIFQKIVEINIPFTPSSHISVGALLYPATFLITDIITEIYGKEHSETIVKYGFWVSFWVLCLVTLADFIDASPLSRVGDKVFHDVFGHYGIATFVSLFANYISQTCDIRLFTWMKKATNGRHLWLRNNFSTIISQLIDTTLVIFALCLFNIFSWDMFFTLFAGSYLIKVIYALCDTPALYAGVYYIRKIKEPRLGVTSSA